MFFSSLHFFFIIIKFKKIRFFNRRNLKYPRLESKKCEVIEFILESSPPKIDFLIKLPTNLRNLRGEAPFYEIYLVICDTWRVSGFFPGRTGLGGDERPFGCFQKLTELNMAR